MNSTIAFDSQMSDSQEVTFLMKNEMRLDSEKSYSDTDDAIASLSLDEVGKAQLLTHYEAANRFLDEIGVYEVTVGSRHGRFFGSGLETGIIINGVSCSSGRLNYLKLENFKKSLGIQKKNQ